MNEPKAESSLDIIQVVLPSPIPAAPFLAIRCHKSGLISIKFLQQAPELASPDTSLTEVAALLEHYFADSYYPIPEQQPGHGTAFQRRVWWQLQQIPVGETRSYGELAAELGSSARAVANACRANPLPILIPCHRVVSTNGPGGYMGQTDGAALAIKRWLLHHERHA